MQDFYKMMFDNLNLVIYRYLAVYQPQLPTGLSHHHFSQGQVKAVYYTCSPWNNATYKLGTKTSLLFEDYFKTPSEFHQMQEVEKKT